MFSLSIQSNLAELAVKAKTALDPASSPAVRASLEAAADIYRESMRSRFLAASGGDGTWAPLADGSRGSPFVRSALQQTRRRIGSMQSMANASPGILIKTGQLFRSLSKGAPGSFESITAAGIQVGTFDRTAAFHQYGTSRMPARPILVPPDGPTLEIIREELAKGISAALQA